MRSRSTLISVACLVLSGTTAQAQGGSVWRDSAPFFEDANVTIRQEMRGYDVRESFPGSPSSSWEVFLDVRTHVPNEDLPPPLNHASDGGVNLLQRFGFRPTGDLLNENGTIRAGDDWGYCLFMHSQFGSGHAPPPGTRVKTNCEGLFSKECVDWLEEFTRDGKFCRESDFNEPYFPWEETPCEDYRDFFSPWAEDIDMTPQHYGNVSQIDSLGRGWILRSGFGDQESYERQLGGVWFVMVGWMPGPVYTSFRAHVGKDVDLPPASFMCLHHDSLNPKENDPEGSGDRGTSGEDNDDDDNDDGRSGEDEGRSGGNGGDDAPDTAAGMAGIVSSSLALGFVLGGLAFNVL